MAAKIKNPIIESSIDDGKDVIIRFTDGLKYRLQHPGNRQVLQWEKEHYSITTGFDEESMLDKFFEHCVFPEDHGNRPTLESISPADVKTWSKLMHKFFSGDIQVILANSTDHASGKKNKSQAMEA